MNAGRLVGQITVDDIVHIIQEEAGEDVLLLSGAGDGDINEPIHLTIRTRLIWLVVNLGTAMIAASVVGLFQGAIAKFALLAVLMPIVSGMGGNAGTQTLAVVVRALATNQLTDTNTWRMILRELMIASANGLALGTLIGAGVALFFGNPLLGLVIASAMLINNLVAGLAGILVPVTLERLEIDPAVSSAVFVTMATDVMGFFSFLGLAVLSGLAGECRAPPPDQSRLWRDLDGRHARLVRRARRRGFAHHPLSAQAPCRNPRTAARSTGYSSTSWSRARRSCASPRPKAARPTLSSPPD